MKKQKLKPKKITSLLFLLITTLFLNSCDLLNDDDTPELPDITQNGANTFGFKVNGEIVNITNTSNQVAIYQGGVLQLGGGIDVSNNDIRVMIRINNPIQVGIAYDLTQISDYRAIFIKRNASNNCYYDYSNTLNGSFSITKLDQSNFIISGTFSFSTKIDGCEKVNITEGRFDLKYIP